jgi:phosphoglycolate phosphatase
MKRKKLPLISIEEYRESFEHPVKNVYLRFGFTEEEFLAQSARFHDEYDRLWPSCGLHHDAEASLLWFRENKLTQFLLSAHEHSRVLEAINHYEISHFFQEARGASDKQGTGKIKESQELFQRHGLRGEETLFIGDSCHDAEVAKSNSAHCALVSRGIDSERKLIASGSPVFQSLGEVLEKFGDQMV